MRSSSVSWDITALQVLNCSNLTQHHNFPISLDCSVVTTTERKRLSTLNTQIYAWISIQKGLSSDKLITKMPWALIYRKFIDRRLGVAQSNEPSTLNISFPYLKNQLPSILSNLYVADGFQIITFSFSLYSTALHTRDESFSAFPPRIGLVIMHVILLESIIIYASVIVSAGGPGTHMNAI